MENFVKEKRIFVTLGVIITLALVLVSLFGGCVGASAETGDINIMSQPFDDLFPPQSDGSYYIYFDFSSCGIPSSILGDTVVTINYSRYDTNIDGRRNDYIMSSLSDLANFSLIYQSFLYKSWVLAYDILDITVSLCFPDLTSYGIPSIDNVLFLDSNDNEFEPTYTFGSSFIQISQIPSNMSALVFTFSNTELSLKNQYNSLNSQYIDLQGQYNTLNTQYSTLQGQYNTLNTQYSTLQGQYNTLQNDYDNLYNDWEEERDSKEHYQSLLREANTTIEELDNRIEQLELFLDEQPVSAGFGWITYAFQKVGEILSIELLPGISIGLLALIPLVLGVVFFVLRLIRGE